jgi:Fe2+ transport system protein FeoA
VTLHEVPTGQAAVVVDLADHPRARRLAEMGLRPGAEIAVLRRTAGDGRLLGVGVARLAVDRTTASALLVQRPT